MESGLAHSACGQAEAAGRTITPEGRNATRLCGLEPESGLFGTLPFPVERGISHSCSTPFFPSTPLLLAMKSAVHVFGGSLGLLGSP